jgi:hypothetical protein
MMNKILELVVFSQDLLVTQYEKLILPVQLYDY